MTRPRWVLFCVLALVVSVPVIAGLVKEDFDMEVIKDADAEADVGSNQPGVTAADASTLYACYNDYDTGSSQKRLGISRSTDGGASWTERTDVGLDLPMTRIPKCRMGSLAGNADVVGVVWTPTAGSVHGVSAAFSTDGGSTWNEGQYLNDTGEPPSAATFDPFADIVVTDATTAYVFVNLQSGGGDSGKRIFKTTDAGATWTQKLAGNSSDGSFGFSGWADGDGNVTLATAENGTVQVFVSTDDGVSWTRTELQSLTDAVTVEVDAASPDRQFVALGRGGTSNALVAYMTEDKWASSSNVTIGNAGTLPRSIGADALPDSDQLAVSMRVDNGGCSTCPVLYASTDFGGTWNETRFNGEPGQDATDVTVLGIDGYAVVATAEGSTDIPTISASLQGADPIPENVTTLEVDATTTGFSDLQEIRTSFSATSPTIWARERDSGGTQRLYRMDKTLAETGNVQICGGGDFSNDYTSSVASFGLAVTTENQPVFPCVRAIPDATSLHLGDNTGEWTAEDPVVVLEGKTSSLPLDARTSKRVAGPDQTTGGNPAVAQVDLLTLEQDREAWDTDDVDISYGDTSWVAFTGSTGTKVVNNVDATPVAPAIGNAFDSIQIHDTDLYVASTSSDEIRRYTVSVGSSLDLQQTMSWRTDSDHALRLTKDGRYLAVRGVNNYTVFNASTFDRLGTTNGTITPAGFDVDANNNYLYGITGASRDTIQRWALFNVTTNSEGDGGVLGSENPPPGSDPLEETATGDADPDAQADGLGQFATSTVAEEFGITEEAAGWVLAALSIAGMTVTLGIAGGGLVSVTAARAFAVGGATAGIAFSLAFSWIPLWFLAVAALVSAAVLIVRR